MTRDGKTALSHYNTNPAVVQIDGTDIVYYFTPKNNVSLAWVNEEHVAKLLSVKTQSCNCGGGAQTNKFILTSDTNVSIWETGHQ